MVSVQSDLRRRAIAWLLLAAGLVLAACGSGDTPCFDESGSDSLQRRILEARIPTAAEGDEDTHLHVRLHLFVRGRPRVVPAAVGLELNPTPERTAALHTHTSDGVVHNEGAPGATLGQFFTIWGLALGPECVGADEVGDDEEVRMWVDGRRSSEYGDLQLKDGQRIVVSLGRDQEMPNVPW
jgi:hypothetical protein